MKEQKIEITFDYLKSLAFNLNIGTSDYSLMKNLTYFSGIKDGNIDYFISKINNSTLTLSEISNSFNKLSSFLDSSSLFILEETVETIKSSKINIFSYAIEIYIDIFWDCCYKSNDRISVINIIRDQEGLNLFNILEEKNNESKFAIKNDDIIFLEKDPIDVFVDHFYNYPFNEKNDEVINTNEIVFENDNDFLNQEQPNGWSDFYDDDEATMAEWNTD